MRRRLLERRRRASVGGGAGISSLIGGDRYLRRSAIDTLTRRSSHSAPPTRALAARAACQE